MKPSQIDLALALQLVNTIGNANREGKIDKEFVSELGALDQGKGNPSTVRQIHPLSASQTMLNFLNDTIPNRFGLKISCRQKTKVLQRQRRNLAAQNIGQSSNISDIPHKNQFWLSHINFQTRYSFKT